jgi:hypothetical protein
MPRRTPRDLALMAGRLVHAQEAAIEEELRRERDLAFDVAAAEVEQYAARPVAFPSEKKALMFAAGFIRRLKESLG